MSRFDDMIEPGDEIVYNEELGCRVNLSRLKRIAKKYDTRRSKETNAGRTESITT